ncbi:MAG TPA: hypothetical protein VF466_00665 [Candidatus Saccharimonadales bacterium]
MNEDPYNSYTAYPAPGKRRGIGKVLVLVVIVLLLALVFWLLTLLQQAHNQNAQLTAQVASLQRKAGTSGGGSAGSGSSGGSAQPNSSCSAVVSTSLKNNIIAAMNSGNFAALQGSMASQVNLVIAGSEKGGKEAAAAAVDDMSYLNGVTPPWNFSLPAATTTDVWAKNFYGQYFTGKFFAGTTQANEVVSFQFDSCSKIDTVFMASDAALLGPAH